MNKESTTPKKPMRLSGLILLIYTIIAFISTTLTRHINDFLTYWGFSAVIFTALIPIIWSKEIKDKTVTMRNAYDIVNIFTFITMTLGIYVFFAMSLDIIKNVYSSFLWLYKWLQSPVFDKKVFGVLVTFLALIAGVILFYFRLKIRAVYGITEVIVGLLVSTLRASTDISSQTITDGNYYLAILTAGVYLVVRGLDNVHQGFSKDPVAIYVIKTIKGRVV